MTESEHIRGESPKPNFNISINTKADTITKIRGKLG